jgi:NADPH:quinone reductase-like Zn-dependent oxidoreductase
MAMKAAIVWGAGKIPVYGDFKEPVPSDGESLIKVSAAALSPLVKARASGAHYSAGHEFPFIAGVDGVGRLADGRRVYFALPKAPYGAMAEQVVAPAAQCVAAPDDLDDVTAAALANPGMSSWAAFKERAKLKTGETVLVNGATGAAGRLAVQIAKHLGAKKVVATGRNVETLKSLAALGADETIPLVQDEKTLDAAFEAQFARGVDVVIDYLWGESAERLLIAAAKASKKAYPVRFVQVGSVSGAEIKLASAVLRSSGLELLGSGIGSVPMVRLLAGIGEFLRAAAPAGFKIEAETVPLSDVEQTWARTGAERVVFTIGTGG